MLLALKEIYVWPWRVGNRTRRGHFTLTGITDVRSICGDKDGVKERVTSAVSIYEEEEEARHDDDALFRTPKVGLLPFRF